jgi:hypothetical protein
MLLQAALPHGFFLVMENIRNEIHMAGFFGRGGSAANYNDVCGAMLDHEWQLGIQQSISFERQSGRVAKLGRHQL